MRVQRAKLKPTVLSLTKRFVNYHHKIEAPATAIAGFYFGKINKHYLQHWYFCQTVVTSPHHSNIHQCWAADYQIFKVCDATTGTSSTAAVHHFTTTRYKFYR